jgi:Fe-Mn family superoxide dismutase
LKKPQKILYLLVAISLPKNYMKHELMKLPYSTDALAPHMSQETLEFHYGKHHLAYVNKLNELQEGTEFADMTLEEIIKNSSGGIFNNAAQIWNHNLFWNTFSPHPIPLSGGEGIATKLGEMIDNSFGSFDAMKEKFKAESLGRFGSGWVWLVQK